MPQTDTTTVKEGDKFSMLRYCTVTEVRADKFTVKTDDDNFWQVDKGIVGNSCFTAHQFNNEVKMTATELAERFEKVGDHVWTVCFHKKVDPDVVADVLLNVAEDVRQMNQAKRRKLARELLVGEPRIMIGHILNHHPDVNGRLKVIDLEVGEERLVDPRTLEWFIYQNTKFIKK